MNTPKFLDSNDHPVTAERLCAALDDYSSDIRRGTIRPGMPFQDYVRRYANWTLLCSTQPPVAGELQPPVSLEGDAPSSPQSSPSPLLGPFKVYMDYEDHLHIIDGEMRLVLSDSYAYDCTDAEREARMEWIAEALTDAWLAHTHGDNMPFAPVDGPNPNPS